MISIFLITIGGFLTPTVNLYEVCMAKAAGVRITVIIFLTTSTLHVYSDAYKYNKYMLH